MLMQTVFQDTLTKNYRAQQVKIENDTVKAVCRGFQTTSYIETFQVASVNIVDITECPG